MLDNEILKNKAVNEFIKMQLQKGYETHTVL